jgi:maleylpyruvate isomerase
MHHVDLGLDYQPSNWPEVYVAWELPTLLATVPYRVQGTDDARSLLAWLSGRRSVPLAIELDPW